MIKNRLKRILTFVCLCTLVCVGLQVSVFAAKLNDKAIAQLQRLDAIVREQINEMEESFTPSPSLEAYKKEYQRSVPKTAFKPVGDEFIKKHLALAKMVLLGDNHTTVRSQENTIAVLTMMARGPRPLTLVLEWIDESYQKEVNQFLQGKMSLTDLRKAINYDKLWGFPWKHYRPILSAAKKLKIPILLVERLKNTKSLSERDEYITSVIKSHFEDGPSRYLVVYGDYHLLGRNHLSDRLGTAGFVNHTVMFGDSDATYWRALKQLKDPDAVNILAMGKNLFFICNGTPWQRQLSYRDYLMHLLDYTDDDFENWVDMHDFDALLNNSSAFDSLHQQR